MNLSLQINGTARNETVGIEISLLTADRNWTQNHTIEETAVQSSKGLVTLPFPIKWMYFGKFGSYNVSFMALLKNSNTSAPPIESIVYFNEDIHTVNVGFLIYWIFQSSLIILLG